MSEIQIYYLYPKHLQKSLDRLQIDMSNSFRQGDKTIEQLYTEIKQNPKFCRNQESIRYDHFLQLLNNNISLYAQMDGKVVGALSFMFNLRNNTKIINFDGICSPIEYSKLGVGQELINSLIRIGKMNDIKLIFLECHGSLMNYYKNKFGFQIISQHADYDSDDDSDDEPSGDNVYEMALDLLKVTGGKKKKKRKTIKKGKKKNLTRKRNYNRHK